MVNSSQSNQPSNDDLRLGRRLNYAQLKAELFASDESARYSIGSPFVTDRIERSEPLDRVLLNGQWFMSGYIVSRQTRDNRLQYSQIVRIYSGHHLDTYHAAIVDLWKRPDRLPSSQFYPGHFRVGPAKEKLVPLNELKFVDYTPRSDEYFQPLKMPSDQIEIIELRQLKAQIDKQKSRPQNGHL